MRAVILAAGRGRRLQEEGPKCLLEVGGQTLLERQVGYLRSLGVEVGVVVGYREHEVRRAVSATFFANPRFAEGNVLSLACAAAWLEAGECLVMDADLLYPREFLEQLLVRPGCALLADPALQDTGEEVKVYVEGERVVGLTKLTRADRKPFGESIGIFRFDRRGGARLAAELRAAAPHEEYETVVERLLGELDMGCMPVRGPWIEIDFPADVTRAREVIAPALSL